MHNCFYTAYGSIFDAQSEGGCARILPLASRVKTAPKSIFDEFDQPRARSFVWFLLILLDPLWFWLAQGEYKRMRHSDCDNWTGKIRFLKKKKLEKHFFSRFFDVFRKWVLKEKNEKNVFFKKYFFSKNIFSGSIITIGVSHSLVLTLD